MSAPKISTTRDIEQLRPGFERPPIDCRRMARWWWFGVAAKRKEIERELREMLRQGIGGVELQAVYPLSVDNPAQGIHNVAYLSDEWRELVLFAMRQARELGPLRRRRCRRCR